MGVNLGRLVLGWLDSHLEPDDYDIIVANPTHTSSKRTPAPSGSLRSPRPRTLRASGRSNRGHSSSSIDAESSAGKGTRWRQKWDAAQELDGAIRQRRGRRLLGKACVVFDDVTTTCAQMHVLGQMLRRWGAEEVDGLVIARSV